MALLLPAVGRSVQQPVCAVMAMALRGGKGWQEKVSQPRLRKPHAAVASTQALRHKFRHLPGLSGAPSRSNTFLQIALLSLALELREPSKINPPPWFANKGGSKILRPRVFHFSANIPFLHLAKASFPSSQLCPSSFRENKFSIFATMPLLHFAKFFFRAKQP